MISDTDRRVDLVVPGAVARLLARVDAGANRLYGSRYNPLYRSGTVTVALLAVLLVSGLYLLLFYRVGSPYDSVSRITDQAWLGRWIRGVHRFAADASLVFAAIHALRMYAQRRSWGRRAMPWMSGVMLVALILVCGWTGYVMVWDTFGQLLAIEGARLLDLVPIFTEPLGRAFTGERALPSAFFFLNLFLHIALPIGLGILLLLHVGRVARPVLLPPRRALWIGVGLLIALAVIRPLDMAAEANPLRRPDTVPLDVFYGAWLPLAMRIPAWWTLVGMVLLLVVVLVIPRLTRPAPESQPLPSVVNERLCTGCEQCVQDCPWEAIAMVKRTDGRDTLVARVDPSICVSCGICAGSCAPMGVGPPGRTGRDQLAEVREFVARNVPGPRDVVVIACARGSGGAGASRFFEGASVLSVTCAGTVHTSVVEYLLRSGAGGVLVLGCPETDCWNREGAKWLEQRMYHEREAELQERVDRRRVAVVGLSLAETGAARRALAELRERIAAIGGAGDEEDVDLLRLCRDSGEDAEIVA